MVRVREFDIPWRFIGWFFFFFILFIIISLYFSGQDTSRYILWFWVIHPSLWEFFYTVIAYKFQVFKRTAFLFGIPSLILIFLLNVLLLWFNLGNDFLRNLFLSFVIISAILFLTFSFVGFVIGLITALVIAEESKIDEKGLIEKSVSFKLPTNEDFRTATINSLIYHVKKMIGYSQFIESGKRYIVYSKSFPLSVKYIFICDDKKVMTIYPFIRDGFYLEHNPSLLPFITFICKNILKLQKPSGNGFASDLTTEFDNYYKPNKFVMILRLFKNIKSRDIGIAVLAAMIILIIILVVFFQNLILVNLNSIISILTPLLIVAVFSVLLQEGIRRFLKRKND